MPFGRSSSHTCRQCNVRRARPPSGRIRIFPSIIPGKMKEYAPEFQNVRAYGVCVDSCLFVLPLILLFGVVVFTIDGMGHVDMNTFLWSTFSSRSFDVLSSRGRWWDASRERQLASRPGRPGECKEGRVLHACLVCTRSGPKYSKCELGT